MRRTWLCAVVTVAACSSAPASLTAPSSTAGGASAGLRILRGMEVALSVEGPRTCVSAPWMELATSTFSTELSPMLLYQSGSAVTLESEYPIDDGTWSNYFQMTGTSDGNTLTLVAPVSTVAWPACGNLASEAVTLNESLTGTLSPDGQHLTGIDSRTYHSSWGTMTARWQWTLDQQ